MGRYSLELPSPSPSPPPNCDCDTNPTPPSHDLARSLSIATSCLLARGLHLPPTPNNYPHQILSTLCLLRLLTAEDVAARLCPFHAIQNAKSEIHHMVFTIRRSAAAMEDIADNEAHGRWDGQDAEVYQGLFHLRMMTSRLAELLEVAQEQVEQCGNWEKVTLKEWEQTLDAVTETLVWLSEVEGGEILLPRKGRQRGLKETEELETMVREIGIQDQVTTLEELNGVLSKMAVSG